GAAGCDDAAREPLPRRRLDAHGAAGDDRGGGRVGAGGGARGARGGQGLCDRHLQNARRKSRSGTLSRGSPSSHRNESRVTRMPKGDLKRSRKLRVDRRSSDWICFRNFTSIGITDPSSDSATKSTSCTGERRLPGTK